VVSAEAIQSEPFEMLYEKLLYVSLSSLFEYELERCPYRLNGGFIGGSAAWPFCMRNFRVLQGPSELFDVSTIVTTFPHVGTLRNGTICSWKMV
jgi:hypothetical protein